MDFIEIIINYKIAGIIGTAGVFILGFAFITMMPIGKPRTTFYKLIIIGLTFLGIAFLLDYLIRNT